MLVSVHPLGTDSVIRVKVVLLKVVVSRVVTFVGPLGGSTYGGTRNWLLPVSVKLLTKLVGCSGTKNTLLVFVKLKFWLGEVGVAALLTTMMVGRTTTPALSERSWAPTPLWVTPLSVRLSWNMWYGEP